MEYINKNWKKVEPTTSVEISVIWTSSYTHELEFAKLDTNNEQEVEAILKKYVVSDLANWKKNNPSQYYSCLKALIESLAKNDINTLNHSLDYVSIYRPNDYVKFYTQVLNQVFPIEDIEKFKK